MRHLHRRREPRAAALTLLFLILSLMGTQTLAIEQPDYQLVRNYPDFELRQYGPMLLAETRVSGDFDAVGNRAFRLLADYIFGGNTPGEKIAMTAPVSQRPAAPTSGGTAQPRGDYVVTFMMPSRFTAETIPAPNNPAVQTREEPARLMAALRYSGRWTWSNYRNHEQRLLDAVRAAGLTPLGAPVYARYNAPFTPWPFRRNEVLVEVSEFGGNGGEAGD
jgi:hypothetical protein